MDRDRLSNLSDAYKTNTQFIHHFVGDVSHEASLSIPSFRATSLNWVLGHIVWRRNSVLAALGQAVLWNDALTALYNRESQPEMNAERRRDFEQLIADLDLSQAIISEALVGLEDAQLDQVVENDMGEKTLIAHLEGFHWHETYHIGQLSILRSCTETME